jgi:hypothetical protein
VELPDAFTSYFLLRLKSKGEIERVLRDILANISGIQTLTPDQFRDQSRSFWLSGTGAGAALFAGALLSVIVGTAIVAQTLYSSTKEHLYEVATLRAIGASNRLYLPGHHLAGAAQCRHRIWDCGVYWARRGPLHHERCPADCDYPQFDDRTVSFLPS